MKKFLLTAAALCGVALISGAAEKAAAAATTPAPVEPKVTAPAQCEAEQLRPLSQWTPFQIVFFPNVPNATWNSNVFGIKTGQPASGGIGRVFGLEASWVYSGTDHIKGIQACWVHNQNKTFDGLQSSFVSCLNFERFNGIQATLVFCYAGDYNGLQASLVSMAGNLRGVQAALGLNISGDVTGFQAAGVNVVNGTFTGVQCGLYSQVEKCNGLQLGLVNISGGKGMQFGLINYIEDAWIPVMPILNFSF